jgi:hypothetical protein
MGGAPEHGFGLQFRDFGEDFVLVNVELGLFGGEHLEGDAGEAMLAGVLRGAGLALSGARAGVFAVLMVGP